jgi:hypothetical protein
MKRGSSIGASIGLVLLTMCNSPTTPAQKQATSTNKYTVTASLDGTAFSGSGSLSISAPSTSPDKYQVSITGMESPSGGGSARYLTISAMIPKTYTPPLTIISSDASVYITLTTYPVGTESWEGGTDAAFPATMTVSTFSASDTTLTATFSCGLQGISGNDHQPTGNNKIVTNGQIRKN